MIEEDESGFSGYVPELPAILVTGHSLHELETRASEAIRLFWEETNAERSPSSTVREIEVELTI